MRLLKFFFLFFFYIVNAQRFQFLYNYKFISDTLQQDKFINEIMVLDVDANKKQSVFASLKKIKSDSSMSADFARGLHTFPDMTVGVREAIQKKYDPQKVFLYTANHAGKAVLKVEDERKIVWNILKDKQKIQEYSVQKAVAFFGGRNWEAWFTNEIPISDGPYKFYGLPGLIIQLSDEKKSHIFKLISVQKNNVFYNILEDESYTASVPTSLKSYENELRQFAKDPMKEVRQKVFNGQILFENDEEKNAYLRNMETQMQKLKIHKNNPIEILK